LQQKLEKQQIRNKIIHNTETAKVISRGNNNIIRCNSSATKATATAGPYAVREHDE